MSDHDQMSTNYQREAEAMNLAANRAADPVASALLHLAGAAWAIAAEIRSTHRKMRDESGKPA